MFYSKNLKELKMLITASFLKGGFSKGFYKSLSVGGGQTTTEKILIKI